MAVCGLLIGAANGQTHAMNTQCRGYIKKKLLFSDVLTSAAALSLRTSGSCVPSVITHSPLRTTPDFINMLPFTKYSPMESVTW